MPPACLSRLALTRWEAEAERERPYWLNLHLRMCRRCAGLFVEIAEARASLLGDEPAMASLDAARAILFVAERRHAWLARIEEQQREYLC
jgi:cob(I)alamin adenosyltransferase